MEPHELIQLAIDRYAPSSRGIRRSGREWAADIRRRFDCSSDSEQAELNRSVADMVARTVHTVFVPLKGRPECFTVSSFK